MLNSLIIVGRIISPPEIIANQMENSRGSKMMKMTIGVTRPFKNKHGIYEEDFLIMKIWSNLVQGVINDLMPDTMVAIRGRVQSFRYKDTENFYLEIIADRMMKVGNYLLE